MIVRPAAQARPPAWLLALLVLVAFAFQGTRGIWEPDEGRYGAAAVNMHESGDWLVPTVDGVHPHLTKPPVTYWALAASIAAFGQDEWALRLPGALAFVGTGLLVFGLGRRLCPSKPWLPPTVWALSLAPALACNVIATDPILAFFETAAMYAFVEGWSREGDRTRRWLVLMWFGWGLAFLTKGPPGLLPVLAMAAFLAVHDRTRLRSFFAPGGLALFAVVAFGWFALLIVQQPDRLHYFLVHEVYERVLTSAHDRNGRWYGAVEVYLPMLLVGTLPWSVLACLEAGGLRPAWRQWRERLRLRQPQWLLLTWWLAVPLLVFCLARSRLHLYVLPLFVPLALLMSRPLAHWHERVGRRRFVTVTLVAAATVVALKGTAACWPVDRDARAMSARLRSIVGELPFERIVFVGMRPYYGWQLYLHVPVSGIEVGEHRFASSTYVAPAHLCNAIAASGGAVVYAVRTTREERFLAVAKHCGSAAVPLGGLRADGVELRFFAFNQAARW